MFGIGKVHLNLLKIYVVFGLNNTKVKALAGYVLVPNGCKPDQAPIFVKQGFDDAFFGRKDQ